MRKRLISFLTIIGLSSTFLLGEYVAGTSISKQFFPKKEVITTVPRTYDDSIRDTHNRQYLERCQCYDGFLVNQTMIDSSKTSKGKKIRTLKLNIDNTFNAQDNHSYIYGDSLQKERVIEHFCYISKCPRDIIESLFWDSTGYHKIRDPIDGPSYYYSSINSSSQSQIEKW